MSTFQEVRNKRANWDTDMWKLCSTGIKMKESFPFVPNKHSHTDTHTHTIKAHTNLYPAQPVLYNYLWYFSESCSSYYSINWRKSYCLQSRSGKFLARGLQHSSPMPSYWTVVLYNLLNPTLSLKHSASDNQYQWILVGKGIEMCLPHLAET